MNARQHGCYTRTKHCIKILIEICLEINQNILLYQCLIVLKIGFQKGYVNTSGLVKYYEAYYA